jgi:hypothetical protein
MGPNALTYNADPNIKFQMIFKSMGLGGNFNFSRIEEATDLIKHGSAFSQFIKNKLTYKTLKYALLLFLIFIPNREEI